MKSYTKFTKASDDPKEDEDLAIKSILISDNKVHDKFVKFCESIRPDFLKTMSFSEYFKARDEFILMYGIRITDRKYEVSVNREDNKYEILASYELFISDE